MSPFKLVLVIVAVVFFILAGMNVPSDGRLRFEWLGVAAFVAQWLVP